MRCDHVKEKILIGGSNNVKYPIGKETNVHYGQ